MCKHPKFSIKRDLVNNMLTKSSHHGFIISSREQISFLDSI